MAKCSTSYEIWNTLELHFQSVSRAKTLHLRNLLQTTKKDASTVSEYVLKMKELGDELISNGVNITDEELLLYILDGLGLEYDVVVANLISNSSQTTLQEAQFLLHKHEIRLKRQHSSFTNFHEALMVSKQGQIESSTGSQHVNSTMFDVTDPRIYPRPTHS